MDEVLIPALAAITSAFAQQYIHSVIDFLTEQRSRERLRQHLLLVAGGALGFVALLAAAFAFYIYADEIVAAAGDTIAWAASKSPMLLGAGGLAVGFALFLVRKYARIAYGALEIIIGIIGLAGYPATPDVRGIPWLVSLLALVYIVVRGFDNVEVGINEWRKPPAPA